MIGFTESRLEQDALQEQLQQEQISFIGHLLMRYFDWSRLTENLQSSYEELAPRQIPGKKDVALLVKEWLNKALAQQETAVKFSRQLDQLLAGAVEEEGYSQLQQRIQAASVYFIRLLEDDLITPLQEHINEIRIKKAAKKYTQTLNELKILFIRKKQQLEQAVQIVPGLKKGMDTTRLLSILQEQKKEAPVSPEQEPAPAKGKSPKGETHRISLGLFKEGLAISEIASRRGMAMTTIEGHLASFIPSGEIDIRDMIPAKKLASILSVIEELGPASLNPIKGRLGDSCSYGEIRAVLSHLAHKATP